MKEMPFASVVVHMFADIRDVSRNRGTEVGDIRSRADATEKQQLGIPQRTCRGRRGLVWKLKSLPQIWEWELSEKLAYFSLNSRKYYREFKFSN
jgi:hypothetical protein